MDSLALRPEEEETLRRLTAEVRAAFLHGGSSKAALLARLAEDMARLTGYMGAVAQNAARAGVRTECKAGCDYCCHQHVHLSAAEAFFLAEAVERSPQAEALKARVRETADKLRRWDAAKRFKKRVPCPMLGDDGLCSVYEARPFICRGNNSTSRTACATGFQAGDPGFSAPAVRGLFMLGFLARKGYVDGLKQAGAPSRSLELSGALAAIFKTENAFEKWISRQDIF